MTRYVAPTEMREALELLQSGNFSIIAGGTDVYPALKDRPVLFDMLDLTNVAGLRGIHKTEEGWRIGATTKWTEIVRAALPASFDGLKAAAREVGSIQIQNAGTVAGNICNASPAADGVPPLLTLKALVEISSLSGKRVVALEKFIEGVRRTCLQPGEIVTAIVIPETGDAARSGFRKLGTRKYLVISTTMVAALIEPDTKGKVADARVAVGSCSPVALRLKELEADLIGTELNASLLADRLKTEHLKSLSPINDVRGSGVYRQEATAEIIRRVLSDCCMRPGT
jgi:CO/xanthine dehydrogenase FAD-binding subunit